MIADPPAADLTEDVVLAGIRDLILALPEVSGRPVEADTSFDELGLDSVDRLELLVAIEDRYGIALPDEHLTSPTVGSLVAALRGLLAGGDGQGGASR